MYVRVRTYVRRYVCTYVCMYVRTYVCTYVCVCTTHPTQHEDSVRRLSSFQEMAADHVTLVQYLAVQLAGIQKLALTPPFLMPTSYITPIILCITGDITHLRSGASGARTPSTTILGESSVDPMMDLAEPGSPDALA